MEVDSYKGRGGPKGRIYGSRIMIMTLGLMQVLTEAHVQMCASEYIVHGDCSRFLSTSLYQPSDITYRQSEGRVEVNEQIYESRYQLAGNFISNLEIKNPNGCETPRRAFHPFPLLGIWFHGDPSSRFLLSLILSAITKVAANSI